MLFRSIGHGLFAGIFLHLHTDCATHQLMSTRQMQIVRNTRAIGQIRHGQIVANRQAQPAPKEDAENPYNEGEDSETYDDGDT